MEVARSNGAITSCNGFVGLATRLLLKQKRSKEIQNLIDSQNGGFN
jgi:hypothetical protein